MMDAFCQITAMFAPILLLIVGVLKSRRFLFVAAFPILVAGCIVTLAVDGSSAAFNVIGGYFFAFGSVCFVLSRCLRPGNFVSRDGLGAIGVLFIVLGFAGFMII